MLIKKIKKISKMNCCKRKCSFKNCIEERKETLTKEFQEMIKKWMNEHPEVKYVYMRNNHCSFTSNSMFIYPDEDYKVTIHFE